MAGKFQDLAVPSRSECLALMDRYDMLPNIREHSLLVTAVALKLGTSLREAGISLHLPLIEAGALLHDIGKTACLGTARNHAEWGAQIVTTAGYPEVADLVREHIIVASDGGDPAAIRETEIVNYADKRVLHTQVVTLTVRFADLKERYAASEEARRRLAALEEKARRLESKLFSHLDFTPADLLHLNHDRRKP
ncbi:MAG: HDIG domain-containing metalloprotein [Thermodesulfobacteriota bacterium]